MQYACSKRTNAEYILVGVFFLAEEHICTPQFVDLMCYANSSSIRTSAIPWQSVVLVEVTGVLGGNHW